MIHYRYPLKLTKQRKKRHIDSEANDSVKILIGVTSYGPTIERRTAVRTTWGKDADGLIFLVAGEWTEAMENEFHAYNDVLWVDRSEDYYWGLTPKTMSFWHAAVQHFQSTNEKTMPSFDYFAKTDDDVYFNVTAVKQILREDRPSYWGNCKSGKEPFRDENHRWYVPHDLYPHDKYPRYASGMGVLLSSDAATCAVAQLEHVYSSSYMPMEDVATGLLMKACKESCTFHKDINDDWSIGKIRTGNIPTLLQHGIAASDMMYVHERKPLPHKLVNCGKPSINYKWNHFAYSCAKCVPADWGTENMCSGQCMWSLTDHGKGECLPKPKKKKQVHKEEKDEK